MKLLKQSLYVLILLLVVVSVWVGMSVYLQSASAEINPNASSYSSSISPTFDTNEIEKINARIEEGFSISPEEFFLLTEESD